MQEVWVQSLGWGNPLEKEMAILSSVLAWKIPWTEGLGGLQSMRSQRVKYRVWHDSACIEMQLQCRLALSFLLVFYSCITSDLLIWFSTRQGVPSGKGPCLFFNLFILAVLGLCCCTQAFSSCGELGLLFISLCGLLTVVVSLAEHRL